MSKQIFNVLEWDLGKKKSNLRINIFAYFDFDLMTEDFSNFESMPEASTLEF
uniref:Uncharacterized protein n=1 Tax=Romanomermis culicivorax TaxID=13658 RepID=A0A915IJV7_ROMCU